MRSRRLLRTVVWMIRGCRKFSRGSNGKKRGLLTPSMGSAGSKERSQRDVAIGQVEVLRNVRVKFLEDMKVPIQRWCNLKWSRAKPVPFSFERLVTTTRISCSAILLSLVL